MLNIKFERSPNFSAENWGPLNFFLGGYHQKNDCYYNDTDKRSEELSGPSHLCSTFRSLAVAFGKAFTLEFDLNQSVDQMKLESFCESGAFNSVGWNPFDILNILKWTMDLVQICAHTDGITMSNFITI